MPYPHRDSRQELTEYQKAIDAWQARLWRITAQAIGQWLMEGDMNLGRRIETLKIEELEGMAWAAISAYRDEREKHRKELGVAPAPGDPLKPDPLDATLEI